jgi:hypothetical protein
MDQIIDFYEAGVRVDNLARCNQLYDVRVGIWGGKEDVDRYEKRLTEGVK